MSRQLFVVEEKVPVYLEDDPQNIIYVRKKMDFGTRNKVISAATKVTTHTNGTGNGATEPTGDTQKADASFDLGAYNLALAQHNILGWEGPLFEGVPCTPQNIARFDDSDPLIEKVLAYLNDANTQKKDGPSPNLSGSGGSTSSRASAKARQRASTTST